MKTRGLDRSNRKTLTKKPYDQQDKSDTHSTITINLYDAIEYASGITCLSKLIVLLRDQGFDSFIEVKVRSYKNRETSKEELPTFLMNLYVDICGYKEVSGIQKLSTQKEYTYHTEQTKFDFNDIFLNRDAIHVIAYVISEAVRFEPIFFA